MADKDQYVTQEEATKQLGVTRSTLYYYMKTLGIEGKKFPLDRHVYLLKADFEKIQEAKAGVQNRLKPSDDETLRLPLAS